MRAWILSVPIEPAVSCGRLQDLRMNLSDYQTSL